MASVRTRFAPSPTGYLHIGGARTALYNWLYARKHGGIFVLRVEDTDKARSTDENTKAILDGMRWLGLDWDEGPVLQSARTAVYIEHVERLLASGKAYRCYCTKEELDAKREAAQAAKVPFRYDRKCRYPARNGISGVRSGPFAVRAAFEEEGQTIVRDLVKGDVVFENKELSDEIILRSDGGPMYNLCVVVDDAEMKITHVLRGDDHLNNTPKQIQLYKAFGFEPPLFGHMPLIFGPDKKKLSKRNNVVAVSDYEEKGYLPEGMANFLARLGWAHGDEEIFSLKRLVEAFDIEGIGKSAGIYDVKKLDFLNGHWIKELPPEEIEKRLAPYLERRGWKVPSKEVLTAMVACTRERSRTLVEMADQLAFLFTAEPVYDPKAVEKHLKGQGELLDSVGAVIKSTTFDAASLETAINSFAEKRGAKLGAIAQPLRVALTGGTISPPIYDVITLLGRDRVETRLGLARAQA